MQDNVAGGLCYVLGLITGIVFLVLEPYNRNRAIRFHAFQSIFAHVSIIVAFIALWILGMVIGAVMPLLGLLMIPLWLVLNLGALVLWLVMIIKTIGGSKIVLPIIGPLAEKQA
jgi:uncharacterized membrane protein